MKKLCIGNRLSLPIDAVTQRISILGRTGSGKSYTAGVLVEEVLKAGQQVVILEPKGDWWGLRSSADGKSAGLPITIMGGDHGDVPLEPTAGTLVADVIVNEGVSVILDLSLFESKAAEVRFAEAFADRLYRKNKKPVLLVIDEADIFAPQRPERNETTMLNRMETLCRRGRSKGIGVVLVSQRSASIHKGCLSQTELMVAHQTTSPQDRKAIELWVNGKGTKDQQEQFMGSLSGLGNGTAVVWSPSWLDIFREVKIRSKETYDSSATPRVGMRRRAPKVLAQVDLERLKKHMAATIEKMKQEDPKLLRLEILDLKAKLAKSVSQPRQAFKEIVKTIQAPTKIIEKKVLLGGDLTRLEKVSVRLNKLRCFANDVTQGLIYADKLWVKLQEIYKQNAEAKKPDHISETLRRLKEQGGKIMSRREREEWEKTGKPMSHGQARQAPPIPLHVIPAGPAGPPPEGDSKPLKGERDILESLITFSKPLNQDQIGVFKGIKPKGTTLSTYLNRLRRRGWITNNGDLWELTNDGVGIAAQMFPDAKTPTTEEILALWRKRLLAGERAILDEAVRVFPEPISLQKISEALGIKHTGSTINTYVNRLRRNCLIDVETHGDIRMITASQDLFQEALA